MARSGGRPRCAALPRRPCSRPWARSRSAQRTAVLSQPGIKLAALLVAPVPLAAAALLTLPLLASCRATSLFSSSRRSPPSTRTSWRPASRPARARSRASWGERRVGLRAAPRRTLPPAPPARCGLLLPPSSGERSPLLPRPPFQTPCSAQAGRQLVACCQIRSLSHALAPPSPPLHPHAHTFSATPRRTPHPHPHPLTHTHMHLTPPPPFPVQLHRGGRGVRRLHRRQALLHRGRQGRHPAVRHLREAHQLVGVCVVVVVVGGWGHARVQGSGACTRARPAGLDTRPGAYRLC